MKEVFQVQPKHNEFQREVWLEERPVSLFVPEVDSLKESEMIVEIDCVGSAPDVVLEAGFDVSNP